MVNQVGIINVNIKVKHRNVNELTTLQKTPPYLSLCGRFLVQPLLEEDRRSGPVASPSTPGRSKLYSNHSYFYI